MSPIVNRTHLDHIATITLNRPDRLNAINDELRSAFLSALEDAADNEDVRVVVITGAGRAFCAGGDLNRDQHEESRSAEVRRRRESARCSQLLRTMPKPTIAMINGACAGAGLSWACACDLRYAAESARFNTAFLSAGLPGDQGITWTLQRLVGEAVARELLFLPEKFTAERAESVGLVSAALPDEELAPYVESIARRLADSAPLTVAAMKENLLDGAEDSFNEHLETEAERHSEIRRTEDHREAVRAYKEKRVANYLRR